MTFTAVYSPEKARDLALEFLAGVKPYGKPDHWKEAMLRAHYGASSVTLSNQWFDLVFAGDTIPNLQRLTPNEVSKHGFKRFVMAHFWMWQYPKNAKTFGSRFEVCESLATGEIVQRWVRRISALSAKKIFWPANLDSRDTQTYIITIDGVDCRTWEPRTDRHNMNPLEMSHKHNHGAVKYEIAISILEPRCVWISAAYSGGVHDLTIFREKLKAKIKKWKKAIRVRGTG